MNARLYLMFLIFLLPQHSLVFRQSSEENAVYHVNLLVQSDYEPRRIQQVACLGKNRIYVHSFCGYKCGVYLSSL